MARTSAYSEAPYQGVSQAPTQVRLPTQAEALEDILVTVPAGVAKRPPFQWLTGLSGPSSDDLAEAYISKTVGDFTLVVSNEGGTVRPRLYSLDGLPTSTPLLSPVSVTISPEAQAYLNEGNPSPSEDLVLLTVEDYTFILNKKVTVANVATSSATRPNEAMLWVRQAAYARTYEVKITYGATTATVTLTTPNGKDATDAVDIDTDVIAEGLYSGTYPTGSTSAANGATSSGDLSSLTSDGFTVTLQGGVIYLSHLSQDFALEVTDGQGGDGLLAVKEKVQAFSDLPKKAPVEGFTVRISQQTGTEEDDFWVRWTETAGKGTGVWEETIAPGANLGVDPETLPVGLVYDRGAGTWSIDVLSWTGRTTGDELLAPDPGFIGETLTDITFWRGRLVLLYGEGGRASSSSDPLRLYISTLSQALADDAFEIVNPLEGQAEFVHAASFKKVLILWGRKGQAQVHTNGQPLTEANTVVEPYAGYEVSGRVRPQQSNDRIYFVAPRGGSASAVYEMEVPTTSASETAAEGDDMSVSVPRYIPADLDRAATCRVNYLTVYGKTGAEEVTPHLYRYTERQRVQNAWSRWRLPEGCTYAGGFFVNTVFYCFVLREGVVHLLTLDTADGVTDVGGPFLTRLDFRLDTGAATVGRVYNASPDTTTVTLPYSPATEPLFVVGPTGGEAGPLIGGSRLEAAPGELAEVLSWSSASPTVTLSGDWTQVPLVIGEAYAARWELSRIHYRDPQGRPNRTGKLVLRKLTFDLDRTAVLSVRVTVGGRTPRVYTFESSLLDTPGADYDQVNLYSGPWSVPIGGDSEETTIEVLMDSWAPANILGYTWEGEINPRAMRMQGA